VTLADQRVLGRTAEQVVGHLAHSLGLIDTPDPITAADLVATFDPTRIAPDPWTWSGVT
jgi:hypothetical protein